jgi:5-methylcytosine-specific restriction protein A
MASRAKSICCHAGCGKLLDAPGMCEVHARQKQKQSDAQRGSAHQRGYTSRWQKARITFLQRHPLCKNHEQQGQIVEATIVDHIVPHKGDQKLFWDASNWQPLCKPCHDKKTASEDGGFGR